MVVRASVQRSDTCIVKSPRAVILHGTNACFNAHMVFTNKRTRQHNKNGVKTNASRQRPQKCPPVDKKIHENNEKTELVMFYATKHNTLYICIKYVQWLISLQNIDI